MCLAAVVNAVIRIDGDDFADIDETTVAAFGDLGIAPREADGFFPGASKHLGRIVLRVDRWRRRQKDGRRSPVRPPNRVLDDLNQTFGAQ